MWSEDRDERCDSKPDVSEVVDISLRSRSRILCEVAEGLDCGRRPVVPERKLPVEGGWRIPPWEEAPLEG